jgi:excisionase family DNA binding protein
MSTQALSTTQDVKPLFLRVADVSCMTGVSKSEVLRAIRDGRLGARRYGQRTLLIEPTEMRRWIDAETIESIA